MRRGFAASHLSSFKLNEEKHEQTLQIRSGARLRRRHGLGCSLGPVLPQHGGQLAQPFGNVWKNGTNELCWRDAFWTPATGIPGCDGVPVAQQKAKPTPQAAKVVFNADTFFDFDKSTLKPEGRQLLDQVAQQAQGIDLETIIAVGHRLDRL